MHSYHHYGAYANRKRRALLRQGRVGRTGVSAGEEDGGFQRKRRASWARLLRKILEVDPLLCPRCRVEMKIVSVITDPAVVDRILAGMRERGGRDPFVGRGPPGDTASLPEAAGWSCR